MKPDARLVQDVKRADEQRAEICRELYPLRFAARERRCNAGERQIFQPDIDEKFQPAADLKQYLFGDLFALFAEFEFFEKSLCVADRHRDDFGQRKRRRS